MSESLAERLSAAKTPAEWQEVWLQEWDGWRQYIAEGETGSWPRHCFESMLDNWQDDRDAITALSARVAELEAARDAAIRKHSVAAAHNVIARRLALQDAAKVCDSAPIDAMAYDFGDAIRALSPTLDMDALTARAIEAAQSAYSGAPDSHSQNAANVARAVLSALLEGGRG